MPRLPGKYACTYRPLNKMLGGWGKLFKFMEQLADSIFMGSRVVSI